MTFTLYTFSKKTNSTKRPDQPGTEITGQLIEPFSLDKLDVKFRLNNTANAPTYNYCFADSHLGGRHYFITNWSYNTGVWIAHMEEDHLATYKTKIGNSTQYVVRAESSSNMALIDNKCIYNVGTRYTESTNVPITAKNNDWSTTNPLSKITTGTSWLSSSSPTACVYIIVLNCEGYGYYGTEGSEIVIKTEAGIGSIAVRGTKSGINHILDFIANKFGTDYVSQYVLGVYYCPFTFKDIEDNTQNKYSRQLTSITLHNPTGNAFKLDGFQWLTVGSIDCTGKDLWALNAPYVTVGSSVRITPRNVSDNAELWTYEKARNMYITGQPFGKTRIDSDLCIKDSRLGIGEYLYFLYYIDSFTGQTKIYAALGNDTGETIYRNPVFLMITNFYAEVPYGVTGASDVKRVQQTERQALLSSVGSIAGAIATSGATSLMAAGTLMSNATALENVTKESFTQSTMRGDLTMGDQNLRILFEDTRLVEIPSNKVGRPLEESETISNLSGYVQCSDVHLDFDIPEVEKNAITNYMESGFYYE